MDLVERVDDYSTKQIDRCVVGRPSGSCLLMWAFCFWAKGYSGLKWKSVQGEETGARLVKNYVMCQLLLLF
jgi:hypothetical protein